MCQLTDIPYSVLKENSRAYEVMLLRDQHDNTYSDIAKEFGLSVGRISQLYHHAKLKQLRLYARHLAIVQGDSDTSAYRYLTIYDWYGDFKYVSAYLEKEHGEILSEYRAGEPGHSNTFLAELLPPITEVSDELAMRVKNLREDEKKTFIQIGHEIKTTKERSRDIYQHYYHEKWLAARDKVREVYYEGRDDRDNLRDYYVEYRTAKKRLEAIMRKYPELFE